MRVYSVRWCLATPLRVCVCIGVSGCSAEDTFRNENPINKWMRKLLHNGAQRKHIKMMWRVSACEL